MSLRASVCILCSLLVVFMFSIRSESSAATPDISLVKMGPAVIQPVHITHAGDGSRRLFVVEQAGRIRITRADVLVPEPFLDISSRVLSGGERGLLSVAFPPSFGTSGRFYVDYTRQPDGATVIARYSVSENADIADPSTEEILLVIPQPFANHNGGQLAFGPDGFLYIGMGDGGSAGDPFNNAQNLRSLLGKILRIDVESDTFPYGIPPTNPFAQSKAFPEIWALGLRNPWRFSFDRLTGDLYIGDVGQNLYEEIDFQPVSSGGGENYGWRIMEASHCYVASSCNMTGLVLPAAEYDHSSGDCSVTGGMVSRGLKYPGIGGFYLYGDYCSGRIRGSKNTGGSIGNAILLDSPYSITTFGEDETGNLYVADYASGQIFRVVDLLPPIPSPSVQATFLLPANDSPVVSFDSGMNPLGFGPVAAGGTVFQFQLALGRFSGPVDIYIGFSAASDPDKIFLLTPDLSLQAVTGTDTARPFLKNVSGPLDLNPITLSSESIPAGTYNAYLLITPEGRLDSYYLISEVFVI